MSHDHELRRLTVRLKEITDDQKRVNQLILRSRREEQLDLDFTRRKYSAIIQGLEERQRQLSKKLERGERELDALQKRIKGEEAELDDEDNDTSLYSHSLRRV